MKARAVVSARGARGFDTNTPLSSTDASRLAFTGYTFALRYIPRERQHPNDLTPSEIGRIYASGLSLGVVQHVESATSWVPTADKGRCYGMYAGAVATDLEIPRGTTVWLDLEGVARGIDSEDVIQYANQWHAQVESAGFEPGVYVGWHCGLSPFALYHRLRFTRYWTAYNLNVDEFPVIAGACMRQYIAMRPTGVRGMIDGDKVTGDKLGRFPSFAALLVEDQVA